MIYTTPNAEPMSLTDTPPLLTVPAVPLLVVGFFVALSYPLYALAAAAVAWAGLQLLRYGLSAAAARYRGVRELPLPGVGTVRFRVVTR